MPNLRVIEVQLPSVQEPFVAEERISATKLQSKVQSLRHVFDGVWPVDGTPQFGGLVRAIDDVDREQRRRRKREDAR